MFITDYRNSGGTVIAWAVYYMLSWVFGSFPIISWIFFAIPTLHIILLIRNAILSVIEYFKKRKLRKLRQLQNRT
ncbi:hypothetical protein NHG25_07470 [Aerococcaceae bacterium NML191292]|nr:hypothetical protein [Aerococcaceae bacterium NML191292]MCW6661558.1 hypothetical protein [Aerococcaceae bacterium NML201209]MCW6674947.1 hypothetical protein [Aerococcaceae bacterium NML171108]MCW6680896.1 hypothetical protein [Aerococcaceae bacterium NML130460]